MASLQVLSGQKPFTLSLPPVLARARPASKRQVVAARAAATVTLVSVQHPELVGQTLEAQVLVKPGATLHQAVLKKPLGLTLQERADDLVVEELVPNGHASNAGVRVGDVLRACTARVAQGAKAGLTDPLILFSTKGESLKTTAAAIRSNTCAQCPVVMVFEQSR